MNLKIALRGTIALALLTATLIALSSFTNMNATAQSNNAIDSSSRYQVSSWAYPPTYTTTASIDAKYGAYIVDSTTGDVWLVEREGKPKKIGGVR